MKVMLLAFIAASLFISGTNQTEEEAIRQAALDYMEGWYPDYFFHKGGMTNLTRFLGSYYGSRGIRVNCLHPGGFQTPDHPEAFVKNYSERTCLGRLANDNASAATSMSRSSMATNDRLPRASALGDFAKRSATVSSTATSRSSRSTTRLTRPSGWASSAVMARSNHKVAARPWPTRTGTRTHVGSTNRSGIPRILCLRWCAHSTIQDCDIFWIEQENGCNRDEKCVCY